MSYILPDIKKVDVERKTIFLRADLDVPLLEVISQKSEVRTIEDDTRLKTGLSTIKYLLTHGAKVIIGGHLDRPKGVDKRLSLEPVALWYSKKLEVRSEKLEVSKLDGFEGWAVGPNLFLLENLRFYKEEEENDPQFSQKLASLANLYVNDAFSVAHRAHASMVGIARILPHYAGLRLQEEVHVLSDVLERPKRPLVVLIGGAKLETKLPLVEKMHQFADYVLVGGKIAQETAALIKVQHEKVAGRKAVLLVAEETPDRTDIMEQSVENFIQIVNIAATIIWNGPMGLIDQAPPDTEKGTREIAHALAKASAYKVVGGGDTLGYLQTLGIINKFDFVSTGGGAMLAFLSGEPLPALEALSS